MLDAPSVTASSSTQRRRTSPTLRLILCCLGMSAAWTMPARAAQESAWRLWDQGSPTPEEIADARQRVQAALAALPDAPAEGSPDARFAVSLTRRATLLDELEELRRLQSELRTRMNDEPARADSLQAEIDAMLGAGPAVPPAAPTSDGYRELERTTEEARAELTQQRNAQDSRTQQAERRQEMLSAASAREASATERLGSLRRSSDSPPADTTPELLELQAANAGLDARVAVEQRTQLQLEAEADAVLSPIRDLELRAAELRYEQRQGELGVYEGALKIVLEAERARSEAELAARESAAAAATGPFERFVADWELEVARSESMRAACEPFQVDVSTEVTEQEERLSNDRRELERLRDDVAEAGTGGRVGDAIQRVYRQLAPRRTALNYSIKPRFEERVAEFTDRRFEIDQLLYELDGSWQKETNRITSSDSLSDEERARRIRLVRELRDRLRSALQSERASLTKAIHAMRQLRDVQRFRMTVLDDLETFIQTQVFWIQNGPVLTKEAWLTTPSEARRVAGWARTTLTDQLPRGLKGAGLVGVTSFGLGTCLAAAVALLLHRRTHRVLAPAERADGERGAMRFAHLLVAAAVQIAVLPLFVLFLGILLPSLDLEESLEVAFISALEFVAFAAVLRRTGRVVFGRQGLAVRLGWLPEETSLATERPLRSTAAAMLICLVPRCLLLSSGLELVVMPQLLWLGFILVLALSVFRFFSGRGPFSQLVVGDSPSATIEQIRSLWTGLLVAILLAVVLLEVLGRRFAATTMGASLVKTLLTLFVLSIIYRVLVPLLQRLFAPSKKKKRSRSKRETEASAADERSRQESIRHIVRTVIWVAGGWLIVTYWGLNDRVLDALQAWPLYSAGFDPLTETPEWVTARDVLGALGVMFATLWLLRHLPGLYELAVFPRFKLDHGLRYAIVTMSRYGLFFLGAVFAFKMLRVDLSSLAWLAAAMAVGLGFGLQEIVSNFVSGIILLVERPIRVGDMVTVGDVVGKIERINIRATTVLNLDRQEVIVPNRSLIAQNVTNWTLASRVLRIIVPIGVAYGSDVDLVRRLLEEVATHEPGVLEQPPPQVYFVTHGNSSLDFEVRVFVGDPDIRFPVLDRLNSAINKTLAAHNIEIPFPQRVVHLQPAHGDET